MSYSTQIENQVVQELRGLTATIKRHLQENKCSHNIKEIVNEAFNKYEAFNK